MELLSRNLKKKNADSTVVTVIYSLADLFDKLIRLENNLCRCHPSIVINLD